MQRLATVKPRIPLRRASPYYVRLACKERSP